jgi:hypothetical protein
VFSGCVAVHLYFAPTTQGMITSSDNATPRRPTLNITQGHFTMRIVRSAVRLALAQSTQRLPAAERMDRKANQE